MTVSETTRRHIADEVFAMMNGPREAAPFTERYPGYELTDAYAVVENIRRRRQARGERIVGRKIGFTNRAAWAGYGIAGPIWNYLYDRTTVDLARFDSPFPLAGWPNIRMETELALGLRRAPEPGMADLDLVACIDWVALDFEICTSIFPGWRFSVADAATTGVHVALLLGERRSLPGSAQAALETLASFTVVLSERGGTTASGGGAEVLGSPVKAMAYLVRELARFGVEPLHQGDIVTTGTLTKALPGTAGERWHVEARGIDLPAIDVALS